MVDYDLGKVVGDKGDTGNGIASIELLSTSGKVKTYRITFTDGDHFDYQVSDGADGSSGIADIVTSWSATLHDDKVPSEKLAKNSLDAKLDNAISSTAVTIASNDNILITDYSDSNKVKRVSSILASQMKDSNAHSNIGSSANASQSTINTNIDTALSGKANSSSLSTVATTGSYNDLTNKPTIPSITGLEETANKVTSWSTTTTDAHYPSEKLVKTSLDAKANSSSLSTVATSGSYNDLTNKPSIPTKVSDLQNDAGYLDSNDVGAVALSNDYDDLDNKPSLFSGSYADLSNKPSYTATVTSSTTGAYEIGKINVSGSSQTIYGKDTGGSSVDIVTAWEQTLSDTKVPSEKLTKTTINKLGDIDTPTQYNTTIFGSDTEYGDDVTLWDILYCDLADGHKLYYYKNGNANDELATLNDIPSLANYIQKSSTTGLIKNDGTIDTTSYLANSLSSTVVSIASNDDILITDYSDSNKIKRVANILASQVKDGTAHSNIGSSANDTQATINTDINTALGNKVSKSSTTGLLKNDGTVDTSAYITSSAITGMLTTSDIANNLTTTTTGKVLDASQGKALADLIGNAITYITH